MTQETQLDSTAPAVDIAEPMPQEEGLPEDSPLPKEEVAESAPVADIQEQLSDSQAQYEEELQPPENLSSLDENGAQQNNNVHIEGNELPQPPLEESEGENAVDRSCSKDTKTSIDEEPKRIYRRKEVREELEEAEDDIGLANTQLVQQETKDILGTDQAEVFVEDAEPEQRRSVAPLNYRHKQFEAKEITSFGNTQDYANGYKPNAGKPLYQKNTPGGARKKNFLGNIGKINGKLSKIEEAKE